jgi:hypothetical protein
MTIWLAVIGYFLALGAVLAVAGASRRKQKRCGHQAQANPSYVESGQASAHRPHPLEAH